MLIAYLRIILLRCGVVRVRVRVQRALARLDVSGFGIDAVWRKRVHTRRGVHEVVEAVKVLQEVRRLLHQSELLLNRVL